MQECVNRQIGRTIFVGAALGVLACGSTDAPRAAPGFTPGEVELEVPAAGMPNLHASPDGRVLLTYLEQLGPDRWALRLAERREGVWAEPRTVASDRPFFVNWADFPSAVRLPGGTVAVHWLEKVAQDPYAYHVLVSLSEDGGESWGAPVVVHRDASPSEHGFVSMAPWGDGAALVWLDGREMAAGGGVVDHLDGPVDGDPPEGAMTLRSTTLRPDGTLGPEALLDERTCECCQTGLVATPSGLVAAYRDRSPDEVRDISAVRFVDGGWGEPSTVHPDGWEIGGCPVNGPQLAAEGDRVAIAWFTGAEGRPLVRATFSEDGGESWGEPVRVDEGRPIGRVDVELLPDGSAAVSWLEARETSGAVLLRRVTADGRLGPPATISETSAERASGFPRLARVDDRLLVAWTEADAEGRVRVRSVRP